MAALEKADLKNRFLAFVIDSLICGVMVLIPFVGWLIAIVYMLIRDGLFNGQSVGKAAMKLKVVQVEENRNATYVDSALRNLPLAVPFLNCLLVIVEGFFVITDDDGVRLGDKLATTQVTSAVP